MSLLGVRRQERAFERLYRRHVADVYRYALVVLGDPEHAESVTQTTFVRAYRAYMEGERPRNPFNWLLGIAHRVCARPPPGIDAALREDAPGFDEAPTPADIRRALESLGFQERAGLMLREIEGRSFAEIAKLLDIDAAEAERLIFRARRDLREALERMLTCHQAERAFSRELDGLLSRAERTRLRAHLRVCPDCEQFALLQRRHRAALRSYGGAPLPSGLGGQRLRFRFAPIARTAAIGVIALVAGGMIAGGVDPRSWQDDATDIEPAKASNGHPVSTPKRRVRSNREHAEQTKRAPRVERVAGRQARREAQGERRAPGQG